MIKRFSYIIYDFKSYVSQHIQLLHQDKIKLQ